MPPVGAPAATAYVTRLLHTGGAGGNEATKAGAAIAGLLRGPPLMHYSAWSWVVCMWLMSTIGGGGAITTHNLTCKRHKPQPNPALFRHVLLSTSHDVALQVHSFVHVYMRSGWCYLYLQSMFK